MHHRIQHLRSRDGDLPGQLRFANDFLLDNRHVLKRHFHTQVAAGDHDAVGHFQDLIDVVYALHVFDLRDDLHLAVTGIEKFADLADVICRPGKAAGDEIEAHFASENNILFIRWTDKWHRQLHVRHIDAFAVRHLAAIFHRAYDFRALNFVDFEANESVVNQNACPGFYVSGQILICDGRSGLVADDILRSQCEFRTLLQGNFLIPESLQANLRPPRIQQ